jgi:HK97 family phage major capsid protein
MEGFDAVRSGDHPQPSECHSSTPTQFHNISAIAIGTQRGYSQRQQPFGARAEAYATNRYTGASHVGNSTIRTSTSQSREARNQLRLNLLCSLAYGLSASQEIQRLRQSIDNLFPILAIVVSSTDISAQISEARDRVEAIVRLAKAENRDLSDDEQSEVDEILGAGTPGTEGYRAGKITKLEASLKRAKQIEANQAQLALERAQASRSNPGTPGATPGADQTQNLDPPRSRIIVPATAISGRPLKAFKGPEAVRDAYVAGQFYLAALFQHEPAVQFCKDHGLQVVKAAQSGGVDGKGGFLVPTELSASIISLAYTYGQVMANADVQTMISDTKDIVKESGDPIAAWMGATGAASEGTAVPELDFDYTNVRLVANKMGVLTKMSSEITEDAVIDMADNLTVRIARALAKQMDTTGFLGTGNAAAGGFTGILPALAAGSIYTLPAGIDSYVEMTKAHFDAIIGKVDERADEERCAWYVNKKMYVIAMAPIMEAIGGNNQVDLGDGMARKKRMFLGYPVNFVSVFPKSTGVMAATWLGGFGDLEQSLVVGVKRQVQIAISTEAGFTTDQIFIRATFRGAIQAHSIGDATDAGSFVGIKTP